MSKKYDVCGMKFGSKKELVEYVRSNILYGQYAYGEDLAEEHFKFMLSLLCLHPCGDQKIGVGVKKIWIQPTSLIGSNCCFWLERLDGTRTDFSFLKCTSPLSQSLKFRRACRFAVRHFIIDFKDKYFDGCVEPKCPVLGTIMTYDNCHVDHTPPYTFERIVCEFIDLREIKVEDVYLFGDQDECVGYEFFDKYLEEDWIKFHNEKARLRVISEKANLKFK